MRLWTRISIFGCAHNLWHIDRRGIPRRWFRKWDGCIDCFCEFWDAQ